MLGDVPKAIGDIVEVFHRLGVEYRIGGSVASSTLGHLRATNDVDIVADLRPENLGSFIAALQGRFYVDEAYITEAVMRERGFNLIHLETFLKVDIFPVKTRPFDRAAFSRKIRTRLMDSPPLEADLLTPEDVILNKLEWYELGGRVSERQWGDVLGILRVQTQLDWAYLRHWAAALGLLGLLEQALAEAALD
ncbi:MAG: hypothetical protein N2318_08655 [Meiothermus sp.]|nr:hypothetical protein [Meiothermus sp.]